MTISPFAPGLFSTQRASTMFVSMRSQLDDLQRQLATGRKAETYGGLGIGRTKSLDARAATSAIAGYLGSIGDANLRLKFMTLGVEQLSKLVGESRTDLSVEAFAPGADGRTVSQRAAESRLKQALDVLNTDVNGNFVFSGRSPDIKPVASFDAIMNGDATGDGVTTLIAERKLADAGAAGLGRLTVSPTGTNVEIAEEAAALPFGFKLAGASATGSGIAATFTNTDPATVDFDVNAQPNPGDRVRIVLDLPDGTQTSVELTAQSGPGPAAAGSFLIGGSTAATASALSAAVTAALDTEVRTSLSAASAIRASSDFFTGSTGTNPPRVIGGSPATATGYGVDPGKTTMRWYKGDDGAGDARATATVRVDSGETVAVGARANEEAFRTMLAHLAVVSSETFSAGSTTDRERYRELGDRLSANLGKVPGVQNLEDVASQLTESTVSLASAKTRHEQRRAFLEDVIGSVEGVSDEEVAVSILSLQTRLQASYQTTSILSQLSLTNFLR